MMPKVRGRPPKDGEAKRHSVSLRVTPELMTKLDEAVAASGRSLSQELEDRIAGHFKMTEWLGGPRRLSFLAFVGQQLSRIEEEHGDFWYQDHEAWARAKQTMIQIIDAQEPKRPDQAEDA